MLTVLGAQDNRDGAGQWTVVTALFGPLKDKRIVRGRETECEAETGTISATCLELVRRSSVHLVSNHGVQQDGIATSKREYLLECKPRVVKRWDRLKVR